MNIIPPNRTAHSYTQRLHGSPQEIFPLLCPVRECEWARGWDPRLVISRSGIAEPDCVFITGPADNESIWVLTAFQPPGHIEFVKVTPAETVARITIDLRAEGSDTLADVTYAYTALHERGARILADFTAESYQEFMKDWEK
jgi:hypothetical protein